MPVKFSFPIGPLNSLPPSVFVQILEFLPISEVFRLQSVSNSWKTLCIQHIGARLLQSPNPISLNIKRSAVNHHGSTDMGEIQFQCASVDTKKQMAVLAPVKVSTTSDLNAFETELEQGLHYSIHGGVTCNMLMEEGSSTNQQTLRVPSFKLLDCFSQVIPDFIPSSAVHDDQNETLESSPRIHRFVLPDIIISFSIHKSTSSHSLSVPLKDVTKSHLSIHSIQLSFSFFKRFFAPRRPVIPSATSKFYVSALRSSSSQNQPSIIPKDIPKSLYSAVSQQIPNHHIPPTTHSFWKSPVFNTFLILRLQELSIDENGHDLKTMKTELSETEMKDMACNLMKLYDEFDRLVSFHNKEFKNYKEFRVWQ